MSHPSYRAPAASSGIGLVMAQVWRMAAITPDFLVRETGTDLEHITEILSGRHFPSRRFTASYARACGADPLVLLKVWDDENDRRRRPHRFNGSNGPHGFNGPGE
ncbi:hypothetical protein ACIQNU_22240 [Streptomyces sp. NPDC091292]|uniref:hypothetical protein n=1 Tax=Streptomyces sp. NPDC091292 TaxID=3365991 RepID=UPI0038192A2F